MEGLNVLQAGPTLMVSDLFDFSLYVDARIEDIEQCYASRFLPTRPQGTLVLRKNADHSINRLRLL